MDHDARKIDAGAAVAASVRLMRSRRECLLSVICEQILLAASMWTAVAELDRGIVAPVDAPPYPASPPFALCLGETYSANRTILLPAIVSETLPCIIYGVPLVVS